MGRPMTPNAILKKRGSRRVRENEPEFEGGIGDPPAGMGGVALDTWREFVGELTAAGVVLTQIDRRNVINLCEAAQHCHDAQEDIKAQGLKAMTERGETKNQSFTIQTTAATTFLRISSAYGCTPASRGKVVVPKKPKANKFDDL